MNPKCLMMRCRLIGLILASMICSFSISAQAAVVLDGKNWRELTDTINLSYNDVASVCDPATGVCNGTIGSIDFNGWTWASIGDVASLFKTVTGSTVWDSNDIASFSDIYNSAWIGDLIYEVGDPTGFQQTYFIDVSGSHINEILGLTRTVNISGDVHTGRASRTAIGSGPSFSSGSNASTAGLESTTYSSISTGIWMYETVVPIPAAVWLFGSGLIGLIGVARRKKT